MIKYSPKNTDVSKYNPAGASSLVCRYVRPNSPYITKSTLHANYIDSPALGGWYVFLSSKTVGEIETMFSTGDYSFETVKSHGSSVAYFSRHINDISEFYMYDTQGNVTLNIGRMLSSSAKIDGSAAGNGGVFTITSPFTCMTMGINFVGGPNLDSLIQKHSDNYFLFTVGDKDSDAEVKIHNPVLQAGDTVDLSDLTLTIQIPTTVE